VDIVRVVLFYGSSRTALTFFPIHSLGTSILAEVAQGLTVFSITSYPCIVMFIGCFAGGWFSVILIHLQYYCKIIYKSYRELNTHSQDTTVVVDWYVQIGAFGNICLQAG